MYSCNISSRPTYLKHRILTMQRERVKEAGKGKWAEWWSGWVGLVLVLLLLLSILSIYISLGYHNWMAICDKSIVLVRIFIDRPRNLAFLLLWRCVFHHDNNPTTTNTDLGQLLFQSDIARTRRRSYTEIVWLTSLRWMEEERKKKNQLWIKEAKGTTGEQVS